MGPFFLLPPHPPSSSSSSTPTAYDDPIQDQRNIQCAQGAYFKQDDKEESAERKACQFKRSWLRKCSGIEDPSFGYSEGKPCVLLKMNRVRVEEMQRWITLVKVAWES